jgi:hypothetical protein
VKFCHRLGLTYVSCSPFRVPVARLAAAQAALEEAAGTNRRQGKEFVPPADNKKAQGPEMVIDTVGGIAARRSGVDDPGFARGRNRNGRRGTAPRNQARAQENKLSPVQKHVAVF